MVKVHMQVSKKRSGVAFLYIFNEVGGNIAVF